MDKRDRWYSQEERDAAVELYFSSEEMSLRRVVREIGYPSVHTLHVWVMEDPRYGGRASSLSLKEEVLAYCAENPGATYEEVFERFGGPQSPHTLSRWLDPQGWRGLTKGEKKAIVTYCMENPGVALADVVEKFGYPDVETLGRWLEDPANVDRRRKWHSPEALAGALEAYFSGSASIRRAADEFGLSYEVLRQAVRADPRFEGRVGRPFTEEEKREICEYVRDHPGESVTDAMKRFGYPGHEHVLRVWLVDRYGEGSGGASDRSGDLRGAVVGHYFSHPDVSMAEAGRIFGVSKHTAVRWVTADPRFESDHRRGELRDAHIGAALDAYFSEPTATLAEVAEAFCVDKRALERKARLDPRYRLPETYGHTPEQMAAVEGWIAAKEGKRSRSEAEEDLGFLINPRAFAVWSRSHAKPRKKGAGSAVSFGARLDAVLAVVGGGKSAKEAAECNNVTKDTVKSWVRLYREKGSVGLLRKSDLPPSRMPDYSLPDKAPGDFNAQDVERLIAAYKEQEFEADVYKAIIEVLKKDPRLSGELLTNEEKALVIDSLRRKYRLKDLLAKLDIAKSSYDYARKAAVKPDKYCWIRLLIVEIYDGSGHAYGFRRVRAELRSKYGVEVGTRVVRAIMKALNLVTLPAKRLQRYDSYRGSVGRTAPNLLNRDFHAERPYEKLLTDITEFHLNGFKVYLSPVVDCFNGEVVSYAISTRPKLDLVMRMVSKAIGQAPEGSSPIVHSDQGWHYQHAEYVKALKKAGWVQSMSRKGCCSDNSACEGFFGRLKNEFFYNHDFSGYTPETFMDALGSWIEWHNHRRIKESLGYSSPVTYREEWERDHTLQGALPKAA